MTTLITKQLANRAFLCSGKRLYRFIDGKLVPTDEEDFRKHRFPFLIVGLENCQEVAKELPVTDRSDLSAIIQSTVGEYGFVEPPRVGERSSTIRFWQPDEATRKLISSKWLYWVPEHWLLSHEGNEPLLNISRAGLRYWMSRNMGNTYASLAKGLFQSKEYFALSVGLDPVTEQQDVDETAYCALIQRQLKALNAKGIVSSLSAQKYASKLQQVCSWPSVVGGALVGILLFNLLYLGYLGFRVGNLEQSIAGQNIRPIIKMQNEYAKKVTSLQSLEASLTGANSLSRGWGVLASLMENEITLLAVKQRENQLEIRAESRQSTRAIEVLNSLAEVKKAEFITPVRQSLGKERYTVAITLLAKESSTNG